MTTTARTIVRTLPCTIPGEPAKHGVVEFSWAIEHPLDVTAVFRIHGHEPQDWWISRELLSDGIGSVEWVGEGDVRVRSSSAEWTDGPGWTAILLVGPSHAAEITVNDDALAEFLDACHDACPPGSDVERERLAAWVDALLFAWGVA